MEKYTIDTTSILNEVQNAKIEINGVQDLINEIKEVITDNELSTDRLKYIAILGAVEIFREKFDYK